VGEIQAAIDAGKLDAKAEVTVEALVGAGLLRRAKDGVRILGDGEIKAKIAFDVAGASRSAIGKIEAAGGSVKVPEKASAE
jgi:large subunit ribosomal protein L15